MINKETYKDIGKAYKNCLTDMLKSVTQLTLIAFY